MNMGSYSCYVKSNVKAKQVASLSSFLKLVSEESRLKLLCVLDKGENCICEIMPSVGLSQSLISHHFKDLKDVGLVKSEKRGLRAYYSLTEKGKDIMDLLFSIQKKGVRK